MPRGQKVSPHHFARRKAHFSMRTSMIFGADVHDPKGCWKTFYNPMQGKTQRRKIHPKTCTQNKKVHVNKFIWTISVGFLTRVTCREEGKSSRELFEKVRVNAVFFGYFSDRRLIRLPFWDTLREQLCLSNQSALIDASLWRKPL